MVVVAGWVITFLSSCAARGCSSCWRGLVRAGRQRVAQTDHPLSCIHAMRVKDRPISKETLVCIDVQKRTRIERKHCTISHKNKRTGLKSDARRRLAHSYRKLHDTQGGPKNRTCLSVDNSAMVTRRKECDMSKVLECCRQKGPNLHSKSFKYSLPNLPKSSLPLKLGICLHSMCSSSLNSKTHCQKSRFKFCELFSVGALQQIAWSQNFSN